MKLTLKNHDQIVELIALSGVNPEEGKRLAYLASKVPHGGVVVEIGACQGRSMAYLASAIREKRRRDVTLFSVDLWDLGEGITPPKHSKGFKRYKTNMRTLGLWESVKPVKMSSRKASRKFARRNEEIDLLFIDGGHKYEEVLADYVNWSPFVREGGMIVFHDYNIQHPEIMEVVDMHVGKSDQWVEKKIVERLYSAKKCKEK